MRTYRINALTLMGIIRLLLTFSFFAALFAERATGQETQSANIWSEVGRNLSGARSGAAVVWLDREQRFLVVGGLQADEWTKEMGIPNVSTVMTFDPASGAWEDFDKMVEVLDAKGRGPMQKNAEGQLTLRPVIDIADNVVWDAGRRHLYLFVSSDVKNFDIYRLDVDAGKWELFSSEKPPASADGRISDFYSYRAVFMENAATVFDPINDELLFIGGRTANHLDGFVGNWAFSVVTREWRSMDELPPGSPESLYAEGRKVERLTRAAENAVRNALFAKSKGEQFRQGGLEQAKLSVGAAHTMAKRLSESVRDRVGRSKGWQAVSHERAATKVAAAVESLSAVVDTLGRNEFSEQTTRALFEAAWGLNEAADYLRLSPGGSDSPGASYDAVNRCVVVFGGNHGDYLLSDTWIYESASKSWRRVFPELSPSPRSAAGKMHWLPGMKRTVLVGGEGYVPKFSYFLRPGAKLRDLWSFDAAAERWELLAEAEESAVPPLSSRLAVGKGDVLLGLAHRGKRLNQEISYHLMRIAPKASASAAADETAAGERAVVANDSSSERTYLTVVKEYDPRWYDEVAQADTGEIESFMAALEPNQWTLLPKPPRPAPTRDWGTTIFDPDRDQWYHWTGGHMADPTTAMSTYHPAISRWSMPYVAEYLGKGLSFNGRPDCRNHTYSSYAYDPVSKSLIYAHVPGTSVYNPDLGDFEPLLIEQPFRQHCYITRLISTSHGVVVWHPGYLGLLDVEARVWKALPFEGKLPGTATDGSPAFYDSKRDALYLAPYAGYGKPTGQVWRYEMKSGVLAEMNPEGQEEIGRGAGFKGNAREVVYLPKADLALFNNFDDDRMVAYSPEKNAWLVTNIRKGKEDRLGSVSIGLMYDARRDLVWAQSVRQAIYVMRPVFE